MKAWEGPAAAQKKDNLDRHLEGGWTQIVFNVPRGNAKNDVVRYYQLKGGKKSILQGKISEKEFYALPKARQADFVSIREEIRHPNISGPFETGWGYTDFGGKGVPDRIGIPALPGQVSK